MADRSYALRLEMSGVDAAEAGFRRIGEAGATAGRAVASGFQQATAGMESAAGKIPDLYDKVSDAAKGVSEGASGGAASFLKWAAAGSAVALAGVGVYEIFSKIRNEAVELSKQSIKTSTDVETLQKIIFAGATQGVDKKEIFSSLSDGANKLNEVRRGGEEELTKFLDANNVKYKDRNGQLIQANQLLLIGADLISRAATYQDKVKAVGLLGLSEETIPLLERGRAGIQALMDEAQRSGAVRSKELIDTDAEVARKWNETTTRWATTLKGAVLDVADYMRDTLTPAAENALGALNRQTRGLDTGQTKSWLQQQFRGVLGAMGFDLSQLPNDEEVQRRLNPDSATLDARSKARDRDMVDALNKQRAARDAAAKPPSGSLVFPEGEDKDKKDYFDRAQDTIKKRTEEYKAEAQAVGLSTESKVRLKAIADQLSAAKRGDRELDADESKSVLDLAAAEGRAAQAAKDAEQKWQGVTSAAKFGGNELISVLDKVGERGARLSDVFLNVGKAIEHALLQAALLGEGPLASILGLAAKAGTGAPGGLIGALLGKFFPPTTESAFGNVMTPSGPLVLHRYAAGGVATGPQLSLFGEGRQNEAYVPLPDGRSIPVSIRVPAANAPVPTAGGTGDVHIHNYAGANVSAQRAQNQAGGTDLHVMVSNVTRGTMIDDVMNGGQFAKAIEERYGLDPTRGMAR